MLDRLDYLFRFRDSRKFKVFKNIFTLLVLLYYLAVMILIIIGKNIDIVLFMVIPLLFLVSFFKKNDYFFLLAELITIGGDIALMIFHYEPVGFPIYILVQLSYAAFFFFNDENKKRQIIITIIRPIAMGLGVLLAFLIMGKSFNLVIAWAVMYYVNLLINIACAIIVKDPLLIIAFTIFALSDLIIGLNMLLPADNPVRKFLASFNFLHFLYLTSQVLLVFNKRINDYQLSLNNVKLKKSGEKA